MNALLFLFVRSFYNGVKRALTNVRRLISLVVFVAYYVFAFIRPFEGRQRAPMPSDFPVQRMNLPGQGTLDAVVFGLLAVVSIMLMSGVLSYRGSFKPADVDVLFPTPINPKMVLVFRIFRDYCVTLLAPLMFAIIGWRGTTAGVQLFFANFPETGQYAANAIKVAYLLMTLAWVLLGYAASLFVNRSDLKSDRNRLYIIGTLLSMMLVVAVYSAIRLREAPTLVTLESILHSGLVRAVFLPATAATAFVMGPLSGNWIYSILGGLGLFTMIGVSLKVAMSQADWMYDQAAARGFDSVNLRDLQRRGDTYGILAERARKGKLKAGKLSRTISSWKFKGASSLIYKELLLQARGSLTIYLMMGAFLCSMIAALLYSTHDLPEENSGGIILISLQGFVLFTLCTSSAQSGFIELLRRVDFQKPLPFSPTATVLWEVVAKAVLPTLVGAAGSLTAVVLKPSLWNFALASLILIPFLAVVITAVVLLVVVLFPDLDDPTQRGFRGLMTLLGIAIFGGPIVVAFVVPVAMGNWNPLTATLPAVAIASGICLIISTLTGNLYAGFNPNE